ncbi:MAG: hypothetical protein WED01_10450 [Candidatus Rokuibacteriota bacterium]
MPKRLLALNVAMAAVAALAIVYIVREAVAPMPMPGAGRPRPVASASPAAASDTSRPAPGAYGVVTARNLFSPTRSEAPVSGVAGNTPALVKPSLFGVVLREGAPIAYLEDPATKRVAGYRVGDSIVGGTVQKISADSVVISRPDGPVDVRLRDPSKPRPAPVVERPQAGVPPVAGGALPGVIPPAAVPPQAAQAVPPGQPPAGFVPGRRPLPPNLLRRLPQPQPSDASQR